MDAKSDYLLILDQLAHPGRVQQIQLRWIHGVMQIVRCLRLSIVTPLTNERIQVRLVFALLICVVVLLRVFLPRRQVSLPRPKLLLSQRLPHLLHNQSLPRFPRVFRGMCQSQISVRTELFNLDSIGSLTHISRN
jgi:hypothetical protein